MSTWLYLECADHDPPIRSDDVGQHLYDLPRIREDIANREELVRLYERDVSWPDYFTANAAHFLAQHPRCKIRIRDEYGEAHGVTPAPQALQHLIATHKNGRSYREVAEHCGDNPTAGRLQQMATTDLKEWPKPETLRNLARGLRVPEVAVVLAVAESLGLDIAQPKDSPS